MESKEIKTERINVGVSLKEYKIIKKKADKEKLKVAAYVRRIVLLDCEK